MTQHDRDRLVVLKKALKKLITQRQAAEELKITERHWAAVGEAEKDWRSGGDPRITRPALASKTE